MGILYGSKGINSLFKVQEYFLTQNKSSGVGYFWNSTTSYLYFSSSLLGSPLNLQLGIKQNNKNGEPFSKASVGAWFAWRYLLEAYWRSQATPSLKNACQIEGPTCQNLFPSQRFCMSDMRDGTPSHSTRLPFFCLFVVFWFFP